MTVIVSIGVSFLFWPLGGAVTLRSVIPVVATGGHCDIGECHSRCGHWGRCDIVGVIPIVATGGAVTLGL